MNKDYQPRLLGFFAILLAIFLAGCAHPINMAPDLALVKSERVVKLDLKAGYHISNESRALEVTGPGGGGDKVRYFPYRDFEAGFEYALNKVFSEVVRIDNFKESNLKKEGLSVLVTPKIETVSSSSSMLTWPPTQFSVILTSEIFDEKGKLVDTLVVNGSGKSEFQEWIGSGHNFSLSAVRASSDAVTKLIVALSNSKNLQFAAQKPVDFQVLDSRETQMAKRMQEVLDPLSLQVKEVKPSNLFSLQANATKPDADGGFFINVQTGTDTLGLTVDGEEQGASDTGSYTIRRMARIGQANIIKIVARDRNGNADTKTISVTRQAVDSRPSFAKLNPDNIKPRPVRDAVAIIIGIQNYKLIPKAEYASQDAQYFYDYASRALGIKQENIKLLLDDEADVSGILTAFQNWLPLKVRKGSTDVYVFYSGHGLPSADGKSLYFLPVGANRDFVAKTAISQQEIVAALKSAKPKSVTMFIDSCYSGQIRTGETLLASARPVVLTVQETAYPSDFTVITASASDQIASSSPDLKHGIFSYYLMKGLEGEAGENSDGTITIGKLQSYLAERVPRFAMTMSRKQEPQLTGDANRVLVARQ